MKVLITGFDPFLDQKVNPSWEAVKQVENNISGAEIIKVLLPTVFKKSQKILFENIEKHKPDIVISVGQAMGRFAISIERVAINIEDSSVFDNENNKPVDQTIFEDGKNAYFSNLEIKKLKETLIEEKIPAEISNTAGTYVCNHVLYSALYYSEKNNLDIDCGFIHVPCIVEQVLEKKNIPYMPIETIVRALNTILKTSIEEKRKKLL